MGGLVNIISPLTSQLRTFSRKISVKYVGPVAIYKVTDPKSLILCTLYDKLILSFFEHEKLKPAIIMTSQGNVTMLPQLKQELQAVITTT